jgi:hypothetical protein
MAACEKPTKLCGVARMLTPPTIAVSIRPLRRLTTASFRATSADEHAVSTVKLGPCRSKM